MTTRTTDVLRCQCGHSGMLRTSENDQPYIASWVSHKLEGFVGEVTEWELTNVACPACGQKGKVDYAKGA